MIEAPEADIILARQCAEEVLAKRIPPLVGKDWKGRILQLQERIAVIRAGLADGSPEVESAVLALALRREGRG